jgi:hypothetical protein
MINITDNRGDGSREVKTRTLKSSSAASSQQTSQDEQKASNAPSDEEEEQANHTDKAPVNDQDGYAKVAAMPRAGDESKSDYKLTEEEEQKLDFNRKRNSVYSRRKYVRRKIEFEVLQEQSYNLKGQNHDLKKENKRLETLLKNVQQHVSAHEMQLAQLGVQTPHYAHGAASFANQFGLQQANAMFAQPQFLPGMSSMGFLGGPGYSSQSPQDHADPARLASFLRDQSMRSHQQQEEEPGLVAPKQSEDTRRYQDILAAMRARSLAEAQLASANLTAANMFSGGYAGGGAVNFASFLQPQPGVSSRLGYLPQANPCTPAYGASSYPYMLAAGQLAALGLPGGSNGLTFGQLGQPTGFGFPGDKASARGSSGDTRGGTHGLLVAGPLSRLPPFPQGMSLMEYQQLLQSELAPSHTETSQSAPTSGNYGSSGTAPADDEDSSSSE